MKQQDKEVIQDAINKQPMVILYFSNKSCGACEVIRNRVGQILEHYPEVKIIDIESETALEVAASYQVFAMPLFILFVTGKEVIRLGRYLDFMELERIIDRYYQMLY